MQVCRDFFLVLSHQFQKFFHRFGRLLLRSRILLGSRIKVRMKSDSQVLLEQAKAEMENIRREEERQKAEKERRDLQAENKMQDRDRSGFLR